MAKYEDVMRAILALDAYNQGDNRGMAIPNEASVGSATRITDSTALLGQAAVNAGF